MNVSVVENQAKPYDPQKSPGTDSIDSLQRRREGLVKQLESVKSRPKNSQAEQDAAIAQKRVLEKQISTIDQKIQKASQSENGETSANANRSSLYAEDSSVDTGRLLDIYA